MQPRPRQLLLAPPAGPRQQVMVALAPPQGAVHKHRNHPQPLTPLVRASSSAMIGRADASAPMTIALLIALAGSLALMVWIVRRLEQA